MLDLFLQILDAGRIALANGETRNLNNYYIISTTNIDAGEAMQMESSAFANGGDNVKCASVDHIQDWGDYNKGIDQKRHSGNLPEWI